MPCEYVHTGCYMDGERGGDHRTTPTGQRVTLDTKGTCRGEYLCGKPSRTYLISGALMAVTMELCDSCRANVESLRKWNVGLFTPAPPPAKYEPPLPRESGV